MTTVVFSQLHLRWFINFILFAFAVLPVSLFAQHGDTTKAVACKGKKPIEAYWIKNLFFTRGLTIRDEFWDKKEPGAFRVRLRLFYSNPIGNRFSGQIEVPLALVVPPKGKSIAGLGDIALLFQGEVTQKVGFKQLAGLRVYLPTGTNALLGGNLMTLDPQYQLSFTRYKYVIPTFLIEYYHSVIEQSKSPKLRILALEPFITFPFLGPSRYGLSGSALLEWDFDFVADRNGGFLRIGLSKQMNSETVLHIEYAPTVSSYTREVYWVRQYRLDILLTF